MTGTPARRREQELDRSGFDWSFLLHPFLKFPLKERGLSDRTSPDESSALLRPQTSESVEKLRSEHDFICRDYLLSC